MPKHKTHKGVKKRFRVTAKGKVKHRQAGTSHLAAHDPQTQAQLRGTTVPAEQFTSHQGVLAGNSYLRSIGHACVADPSRHARRGHYTRSGGTMSAANCLSRGLDYNALGRGAWQEDG